jgi:integrase
MRAGFPHNLYENKGYYSWKNPLTGEYFGLGTNRAQAFEEALEANLKLAKQLVRPRLVDRISGDRKRSVSAWEEKYRSIVAGRGLTKATMSNYLAFSRHMIRLLGADKPLKAVTALDVSEAIESLPAGIAAAVRPYMRQSFETAMARGWIDANPVRITVLGKPAVKRARLTLEVFLKVYESTKTEWLRNAMALALVSAQRREDVARAQFKDFHDGGWWLTQASEKTDHAHRIFIPLGLCPKPFGYSLAEVLKHCRSTGVVCGWLIHQTTRRGPSKVGSKLRLSTITRAFTEAVEALGIDWGDKTPPTFHEIRSLALRLYGDQGVNVQLLAGHSDPDTTAIYLNSRGQDYARVTV